jgi:CheY-like chemotaxis protein
MTIVQNGKQGVEMATMNLYDILSDIMMPDLDGYGVLYLHKKIQKPQLFRLFSLLQNQNELICVKEWKWVPMII